MFHIINFILYIQAFFAGIYIKNVTMKYSEFLQLHDILEENGITIEEFKNDPILYEGIIGNLFKKGLTSLWKLAQKGIKTAVSKGISSKYTKKLDEDATKIENVIKKELEERNTNEEHYLYQLKQQTKEAMDNIDNKYPDDKGKTENQRRKDRIKKDSDTKIIKYINNVVDRWSEKVKKSITKKQGLTEDDKEELLYYWDNTMLKVKLKLTALLGKEEIVDTNVEYDYSSMFGYSNKI
jgi:hypothetical protein